MHRRLREMQSDICHIDHHGMAVDIPGEVVAGNAVGSHRHMDFTVIGDVVNIAARRKPDPGVGHEYIVGPETYRGITPHLPLDPCAPVVLKGRSEPLLTYRLLQ